MLTAKACQAAKAGEKPVKLFDSHGLHLLVSTTGHKSWRLKYRAHGVEKQVALGTFPETSLADARKKAAQAREMLDAGQDPAAEMGRRAKRRPIRRDPERTFRAVAEVWMDLQAPGWKPRHLADVKFSLERDVFPAIGRDDIGAIAPRHLRELLRDVQARGAIETGRRLLQRISAVFQYAIAEELVEINPAASIGAALQSPVKRKQPALLKIEQCRAFLQAYEAEPGHPAVKLASRLLALTAARPGMVQMAQAGEFEDLDGLAPIWRVPATKMKLRAVESEQDAFDFILPLSRQAVAVVKAAIMQAGKRKYLFPSARHSHRPITDNALNAAYRRVPGFEGRHVPHGWRASFSTIMNERAIDRERAGDRAIIDLMLAHQPGGVESRYNRAAYMPRRREIAQEWADLLCVDMAPIDELVSQPRRRPLTQEAAHDGLDRKPTGVNGARKRSPG